MGEAMDQVDRRRSAAMTEKRYTLELTANELENCSVFMPVEPGARVELADRLNALRKQARADREADDLGLPWRAEAGCDCGDQETSARIEARLEDAVVDAMCKLWVEEGGVVGKMDEGWFRHECSLALGRLAIREAAMGPTGVHRTPCEVWAKPKNGGRGI
jgi:hypothetical protein